MKCPPAPQTFVYHEETLREKEAWVRLKTDGFKPAESFNGGDVDEDEIIDAALRRFQTINDASTSAPLDPQTHVPPTMITVRQ